MAQTNDIKYSKNDIQVTIRNPKVEDVSQIIEHLKEMFEETSFLSRTPEEFNPTIEEEEEFISIKLSAKNDMYLVAEVDGEIIGLCGLNGNKLKALNHKVELGITLQN